MSEKNLTYKIYKYTAPNGMSYIGQTQRTLKKRADSYSGYGYRKTTYFYNAIKQFGDLRNFKKEILLTVGTKEMANKAEEAMIVGFNTLWPNGYNDSLGHSNPCNEETKRKISMHNKGHKPHDFTLVSRKRMSEKKKGFHWYNNGVESIQAFECPDGFQPGRIYKRKKITN